MVQVVGYTYESAHHCVDCTKERFATESKYVDENGIPEDAVDNDGNQVHALFDGFECDYVPSCDGCFEIIEGATVIEYEY